MGGVQRDVGVYMGGVQRDVDVYNGVYRGVWVYIWMVYKGCGCIYREIGCIEGCGCVERGLYRGCGCIEWLYVECGSIDILDFL